MLNKKTQIFFLSSIFYLLSSILFSGCATTRLALEVYPESAITIGGIKYFPLINICEKKGIAWNYDAVSHTVILSKEDSEIRLLLDSSLALVDGKPEDLKQPLMLYRGILVVPYTFNNSLAKLLKFRVPPDKGTPPYYRISKICIDAGHGGKDPGAVGRYYGLKEKNIVLDITMRMRRELKAKGLEVVTTRSSDIFIPLEKRAQIANRSGADLFISIHANASRQRSTSGFEVYYIGDNADDNARALALAENGAVFPRDKIGLGTRSFSQAGLSKNTKTILWDLMLTENRFESVELARQICKFSAQDAGVKVLGIKGGPFAVLRQTQMPAILVEVGFISNSQEEKYFKNAFYRQQIAEALVCGILSYIKSNEKGKC